MQGQRIGSYLIVRLIGQGGMGDVYEALNESIERRVAIKILNADCARQPELVSRFFNEARATNRIDHPGIVQIHESGYTPDGAAYIVMEYLRGETLGQRLRSQRLSIRAALQISWQIADALAAAHEKGIIHRDLKPGNLMLIPDSLGPGGKRVKVLDFGIAKLVADARQGRTASQVVMGTPTYMSPEQCRGAGEVDALADVYSLGVVLFEMLAGRTPFVAEGSGELIGMHLYKEPPPLDTLASVPPELVELVSSMLQKERALRPAMAEVAARLRQLAESAPERAGSHEEAGEAVASSRSTLSHAPSQQVPKPGGLSRGLVGAVAAAGVLLGGALWFAKFRTKGSTPSAESHAAAETRPDLRAQPPRAETAPASDQPAPGGAPAGNPDAGAARPPLSVAVQPKASARAIPGQKTSSGSQLHEFSLWIDVPPDRKGEIRQVSYRFNNPSFRQKVQSSSDAPTGFRVSYRGWGCLERVTVALSLQDGSELPLDFNMCTAIDWK